jgi:SAM-dependent methyltransferase
MKLEPTGERMIVEEYHSTPEDHLIYLMHLASYRFAERFTNGNRVLDYGCGSGYGSALIAETASHVTAVDIADDAVAHACANFSRSNLVFRQVSSDNSLPFGNATFDVVLSFQVFEHVRDTDQYLSEIRRVLTPHGTLVLITPDRRVRLFPFQRPWNRWHVREYSPHAAERLLRGHFKSIRMLGMSARTDVIGLELARYRKTRWLTLPATMPFLPDRFRVAQLNALHKFRRAPRRTPAPPTYNFDLEDIEISETASPSLNIVAICSNAGFSPEKPGLVTD